MDHRMCTLCEQLVDLDAPGVLVVQSRGGNGKRITLIDAGGKAHVVTTKRQTEKVIAARTAKEKV
jgi:hypothetical protein